MRRKKQSGLQGLLLAALIVLTVCPPVVWAAEENHPMDTLDTRGPVVNAHMTVVATPEGVQAPGYRYTPPAGRDAALAGQMDRPGEGPGATVLLRKTVTLDGRRSRFRRGSRPRQRSGSTSTARSPSAGRRTGAGTLTAGRSHRWFYDCRDFTPLFHPGKNILAVVVFGARAVSVPGAGADAGRSNASPLPATRPGAAPAPTYLDRRRLPVRRLQRAGRLADAGLRRLGLACLPAARRASPTR